VALAWHDRGDGIEFWLFCVRVWLSGLRSFRRSVVWSLRRLLVWGLEKMHSKRHANHTPQSPRKEDRDFHILSTFWSLFIHPFFNSFILQFIQSFIHPFIHSAIHSFIHSFILQFIHSTNKDET